MSRPIVIETNERPSGILDFTLSAGKEGKERVRVIRTLFQTFACMTCNSADACIHADVARDHYDASTAARSAA